jgi:flagellin
MRIQNNIMALNTHRQLAVNNLNQSKSTEKLSSGYRINRAADDASGLSISEKMRAQIRGLNQASANAQDGISLIQAAEGALQETHSILQRMRELAVKAANDTNETLDRDAIAAEISQLTSEVDRIANTTEFNKKTLLDGSLNNAAFAKVNTGVGVSSATPTANAISGTYVITSSAVATRAVGTYTANYTDLGNLTEAGDNLKFDFSNMGITTPLILDGNEIVNSGANDAERNTYIASRIASHINGYSGSLYTAQSTSGAVSFTAKDAGEQSAAASIAVIPTNTGSAISGAWEETSVPSQGTDATLVVSGTDKDGAAISGLVTAPVISTDYDKKNGVLSIKDASNTLLTVTLSDWSRSIAQSVTVDTGSPLTLQVGANSGTTQTISVGIENLSAVGLGVNALNVSSHKSAQAAIDSIESAINKVSDQRGALGAVQNRLEHTVANLDTVSENLTSAESRIRDVDMAKEMMNFTKNNILQQAATAMLAQANQAPQTVLQLLR